MIIILVTLSNLSHANEASQTCQMIQKIKAQGESRDTPSTLSYFFNALSDLFKNEYARPYTDSVKTPLENQVSLESFEGSRRSKRRKIESLKNYIILFEPAISQERKDSLLESYEQKIKEIKRIHKNIDKLVKSKNVEHCIKRFKKYPASETKYNEIISKIKTNVDLQSILASQQAEEKIDIIASSGLHNDWIKIRIFDINLLKEIVSSQNTGNLLIVAHSDPTGAMIDSYGLPVPVKVFENISATIKSIALFTCFGKEVRDHYKLSQILKSGQSIYGERSFITIKESSRKDKTPVKALSNFLRKFDQKIYKEMRKDIKRGAFDSIYEEKEQCYIEFESTDTTNNFVAYLNNSLLGQIKHGDSTLYFDCSKLDELNNLRIVSRSGKPSNLNQSINILDSNLHILKTRIKEYNSRFKAAKWDFKYYQD